MWLNHVGEDLLGDFLSKLHVVELMGDEYLSGI